MIIYRKATVSDADDLAKIRSIFLMEAKDINSEIKRKQMETANKNYFKTTLLNDEFIAWLALDDDNIIATSGLTFSAVAPSFDCQDGKMACVMNMFTFPKYRKQGIGTELFKRIVEEAKNRGYKKITLNATDMGRPVYEKYGFKRNDKNEMSYMVFYVR